MTAAEWALLSSVIGGIVGASIKFTFDDVLGPLLGSRRETRRVVQRYSIPLLRSGEVLERRINNFVQNIDGEWYGTDSFYRLSTLYAFGEHLGWIRIVERRFGFVPVEGVRKGRFFTRRLNGIFRALTSHAYLAGEDVESVSASAIPRLMLTAVGEAMVSEDGETVIGFTDFAKRYVNDPQFGRWFVGLDDFLRRAKPSASLSWDRLIIAGAELRALLGFLDPKGRMVRQRPFANLDRLTAAGIAPQLIEQLNVWVSPPKDQLTVSGFARNADTASTLPTSADETRTDGVEGGAGVACAACADDADPLIEKH